MTNKNNSVKSKKAAGAPAIAKRHFELAPILAPSLDSTVEKYEAYLACYCLYRESVETFRKQQVAEKRKQVSEAKANPEKGSSILLSKAAAEDPQLSRSAQPEQGSKSLKRKEKRALANQKRKARKAARKAAKPVAEAPVEKPKASAKEIPRTHKSPSATLRQQARAAFRALPTGKKTGANSKKVYKSILRQTYAEGRRSGVVSPGGQKEALADRKTQQIVDGKVSAEQQRKALGLHTIAEGSKTSTGAGAAKSQQTARSDSSKFEIPGFLEHGKTKSEYVRASVMCGGKQDGHQYAGDSVPFGRGLQFGYGRKCRICSTREYVLSASGQIALTKAK